MSGTWISFVPVAALALATPAGSAIARPSAVATVCDRECLKGVMTTYITAMLAKAPEQLPLAKRHRFTENGAEIALGEGLWRGISSAASYRYDYVDTQAGQIATNIDFVENGKAGLMSIRLKVVGRRITEIETVLARGTRNAAKMVPTEALWDEIEPAGTRLSREQLIKVGVAYADAVASSDGSRAPFDEQTCVRLENGGVMATTPNDRPPQPLPPENTSEQWLRAIRATLGMGCSKQISTGLYGFITSYDNIRFDVVDVERQIVYGNWNFRRRGDVKGVTYNGKFVPFMESTQFPNENLLGEGFKIRNGKIIRVQGLFLNANVYRAGTGWGPGLGGGKEAGPR